MRPIAFRGIATRPPDGPCPLGFTCNNDYMANCSEIREAALTMYQVGKEHENETMMKAINCDRLNKVFAFLKATCMLGPTAQKDRI